MENPLLNLYKLSNDEFIPFDKIKNEHFEPAFEIAFAAARENLDNIINNPEEPTFENTIEAIEYCSEQLDEIVKVFLNLKEAHTNPEIDRIAEVVMPQVTDWGNDVMLNEELFKKVKTVFDAKPSMEKEQQRLLEITYRDFVMRGALLSPEDKILLKEYDKQLESLSRTFAKNLLKATNNYELIIEKESDLAGLPARVLETAREEAAARGKKDAWAFTLQYPSYGPFMQYADDEKLRKEIMSAFSSRGMKEGTDNQPIVLEIVAIRDKKAKLLGCKNFAEFVLQNRMAKTPKNVDDFLQGLYVAARPYAEKDFEELRACKELLTGDNTLEQWDVSYYSEKIRQQKYHFDEELFRPYLEIENVINSIFEHARFLYGLTFKKNATAPVFHKDVVVYDLRDANEEYIGTLYFDLFPRSSKNEGAWIDVLRTQHKKEGSSIRPHALIVGNLTKPTEDTPSLLSIWDAETIFHEFGHGLHILLSDCKYASLAGTNTLWDFVELPSQFMQTFFNQKKSLEITGKHYQTGEALPEELIEKNMVVHKFMAGRFMASQIGAAILDMKWHDGTAEGVTDIQMFEEKIRKPFTFLPRIPETSLSTNFSHVFNGGYSAGYYCYHWAEVLAADAFEYFNENGLFNKDIALSFRTQVLSKGNTAEPMDLYMNFRGQEPDPHALLRIKGLE